MKIYRPDYVGEFKCDGQLCGSRCCNFWQVKLDEDTEKKFAQLPPEDCEEFFCNVTDFDNGHTFKMNESGACPFLDENLLCRLQLKYGEEFLPAICQSYPRVTYKLSDEKFFQAMTLTCPIAAIKILLRKEPIKLETATELGVRMIFDYTEKLTVSIDEFFETQRKAIEILQRRDFDIDERLKCLCEYFGVKKSAAIVFNPERHATTMIDIFAETYGAEFSEDKKSRLIEMYSEIRADILSEFRENYSVVSENYLVNEFMMRLYPYAFDGDEKFNCRVFVTAYKLFEFAAVLTAISRNRLNIEDVLEIISALGDKINHGRGGMNAIKTFAATNDAEDFYSVMIDA